MVRLAYAYLIVILAMFIFGCMVGYLFEVIYRRFFSAKKWVNPGFMKGPWLPLYGFGIVVMFAISATIIQNFPTSMVLYNPTGKLFTNTIQSGPTIYDLIPISIIFVCLILLEFIAGIIFIKGFKVRLWDYSNLKGNILGVICPQFSLIWLVVDLIYYYGLSPYIYNMFTYLFKFIFEGGETGTMVNVIFILLLGVIYGVFIYDFVSSLNIFTKLTKLAKQSEGLKHYERFREAQKANLYLAKAKLLEKIPESVKAKYEDSKKKAEERNNKFTKFIDKLVYIDPSKKNTKDNYDSQGRPIKED